MSPASNPIDEIRADLETLKVAMKAAGVPSKLRQSIARKCLLSPRRQTGRVELRTNRDDRWDLASTHPDYSPLLEAHLILLRLLIDMLNMRNAPQVDRALLNKLSKKYFGVSLSDGYTTDPLTDEVLDYLELVKDVVTNAKHGYSKFHIGHQDPRFLPKHVSKNIRWQLKASNDFQQKMYIGVARVAWRADQFTRTRDKQLAKDATEELRRLIAQLENLPPSQPPGS